ncbi:peptidoglycan-binding protein LysM [Flavobacterium sp. K5-23]|uniref:peptidoglycan-binding protein LysM n=1 Tax=Flavobacterium sp. K5-23 TaxID=2746225 RepID=UPI00200CE7E3|nr:peptidoglycan-binding protein LysM [Flavobacterium sp. K5-23]UQD54865.1 peptidoglycan-binding protein LysM [Flavobacterium sp. K5-23]
MVRKWYFYTSLAIIIAYLSSGFRPFELETNQWFLIKNANEVGYVFPSQDQEEYINMHIPFTGNLFIGFKEALAFKESEGKYKKINSLGYLGKYQFGVETLKSVGVYDVASFLRSPKMQEKAFVALLEKNKWELQDIIEKYDGVIINGITVTESGILAAAHLGGAGSVKRFFRYKGKKFIKDAYGTSISSYMKAFGGYDTSLIIANNNAIVSL